MKVLMMTLAFATAAPSFANMMTKDSTVMGASQLDDLIRGEMAAVKAYDQVISKIKDEAEAKKLKMIKESHVTAIEKLKSYGSKDVQEDTKSAGAWGTFAKVYTGGASLLGDKTALKALKQGEEHGVREYKEALNDDSIKPELKEVIRTQFLPKQEEHIKTLNTFM